VRFGNMHHPRALNVRGPYIRLQGFNSLSDISPHGHRMTTLVENVGFQVRSLRHCPLHERSLPPGRRHQNPNFRGLFALYLLTVPRPSTPQRLSLRPFLSKADDSAILVRFL